MEDIRGIELIGEMTKEALVDEIQAHNRKIFMATEITELKSMVIESRINLYRQRLEKEAKITVHRNIFGAHVHEEEKD